MEAWIFGIIGTVFVLLFGIVHKVQDGRLGRVEKEKVDKSTCEAVHEGIGDMREMVTYLYQDRRTWKKQNGHSE